MDVRRLLRTCRCAGQLNDDLRLVVGRTRERRGADLARAAHCLNRDRDRGRGRLRARRVDRCRLPASERYDEGHEEHRNEGSSHGQNLHRAGGYPLALPHRPADYEKQAPAWSVGHAPSGRLLRFDAEAFRVDAYIVRYTDRGRKSS